MKTIPIDPSKIADYVFGKKHVTIYVSADHVRIESGEEAEHKFCPVEGDYAMIAVNRMEETAARSENEVFLYEELTQHEARTIEKICVEIGGKTRHVSLDKRIFWASSKRGACK